MNVRSLRAKFVVSVCFLLLVANCASAQEEISTANKTHSSKADSSPVAPETKQRLLSLVLTPAPAQAVLQDATAFYSPETLYQYMDGGADIYLLYDFQLLLHQEFKAKQVDVTVDVFDMGTQERAFGMYASERSPNYDFISIGTEGYRNEGILNFLKGRYYVKLAGFGSGADAVLDEFARAIAARIDEKAEFPTLLQQLPQANRKPRSEQYLLKDPLGNAFLGPAYLVSYANESTLLVSVAQDAADAQKRLALLADHFRKTGNCAEAPDLAPGAIRASNSFEGNVLAAAKANYVLVLYAKVGGADAILKEALRNIQ
jgi:hypothetical protein